MSKPVRVGFALAAVLRELADQAEQAAAGEWRGGVLAEGEAPQREPSSATAEPDHSSPRPERASRPASEQAQAGTAAVDVQGGTEADLFERQAGRLCRAVESC